MKLKLFLILCFSLFLSCLTEHISYIVNPSSITDPKVIPVYLEQSFSLEEQQKIQEAVDRWNYALNDYVDLKIVSNSFNMDPTQLKSIIESNDFLILKIDRTHPWVEESDLAFTDEFHVIYIIRERIADIELTDVVTHELGHALGAKHSEQGLMKPHYVESEIHCIDQETIKEIAAFQNLKVNQLNYCVID